MDVRVDRIWIDVDTVQKHHHVVFEHERDVELIDLVSAFQAPDLLVDAAQSDLPIFNRDGHATIVRQVGPHRLYYLFLRPLYALTRIVVDPDDVFVDMTRRHDQLIYSFYNGTRRAAISITAKIEEDVEGIATDLSSRLKDPVWRQYFVRKVLLKPDARSLLPPEEGTRAIMTAAQVARYLNVEEKTIRNWTSEGKIPHAKLGSAERYRKAAIDAAVLGRVILPARS